MFQNITVQTLAETGSLSILIFTILLAFVLSTLLAYVYQKTFRGLSYSRNYVQSIVLISIIQEITKYQLEKDEATQTINNRISELSAKKQAIQAELNAQIHTLEQRLKTQAEIFSTNTTSSVNKPNNVKLNDLKKQKHYSLAAIQAEIDHLSKTLQAESRPINVQIDELSKRQKALLQQTSQLNVKAQFNGRVGNVNFKNGELVPPFQDVLSVHSLTPRYIKAFIHEQSINNINLGQQVCVRTVTNQHTYNAISGQVESLGNRIVEFPERLKINPAVPAWGREVLIRLHDMQHPLLFGEKVEVLLKQPQTGFF